jgi:hypothetical protein
MHRQIRRQRPTLKTAHQFFSDGYFTVDPKLHSVSDKEFEDEAEKISDELKLLLKQQFPRTQNLEHAILKGHLIIEHALVQYIRCFARTYLEVESLRRFSFSQKLEIAYLLGFGVNDPILLPTIEGINKVRNQVAHTFELNKNFLDEILQLNHEEYKAFKPKKDIERIRAIRWICAGICGRISGEAIASVLWRRHLEKKM